MSKLPNKDLKLQKEILGRVKALFSTTPNLTVYGFAKENGITESTLGANMRGENGFRLETLIIISQYFGVTLDWVVFGEDDSQIMNLHKLNTELSGKVREQNKKIQQLKNFIVDYLEEKQRPAGEVDKPASKRTGKHKG